MRLILIRHGETEWNRDRRLQGTADSALTEQGVTQALRLRPLLESLDVQHAVSSSLGRARETARLLAFTPVHTDERWREADLGDWTARLVADLPPDDYDAWRIGTFTPTGGEATSEFRSRIEAAVAALDGQTTAVVTHGGVIRAVLHGLLGIPASVMAPPVPGSVTVIDRLDGGARLVAYNLTPSFHVDSSDTG